MGFFIRTGTSAPRSASATSCTLNGFTVVRAPIQSTSTSKCSASSTCLAVATSIATGRPVSFLACCSQGNPFVPMPSKLPGRVRGFQIAARRISTLPVFARRTAVSTVCSSVSALQGPEMIRGRFIQAAWTVLPPLFVAVASISSEIYILSRICIIHPYPPSLEILPVDSPDHLGRRPLIDLDPAVHLLHIDPPE